MLLRAKRGVKALTRIVNTKTKAAALAILVIILGASLIAAITLTRNNEDKGEIRTNNEVVRYYEEKLPQLEKDVKADGKNFSARLDYAIALYATGNLNEAKKQYEAAISMRGDDVVLRNNLGNVLRDKGDYNGAIREYQQAIQIDPRSQNAYINLANLQTYTLNKPNEGIDTYKQAVKAMPENIQLELQLGLAYEHAGNNNEAIKIFKSVLSKDPNNTAAKNNLTRLGAI